MSRPIDALPRRLAEPGALVGVVGLGYVGLPLALELAATEARVLGIDSSSERVEALAAGRSHVDDVSDARLAEGLAGGLRVD
ncbi:MAG: NAD(P)-binding domain-containing protein, partial [Acidobacteriota bacterium]